MSYNEKTDTITKEEWQARLENFQFKQADMNKLIMNYLVTGKKKSFILEFPFLFILFDDEQKKNGLCLNVYNFPFAEGFKEAAEKFQMEAGVEPSVELSTLDNRILIRDAVQSGRIQEATHLVNQLHPELLDNDRYLYFHLQQLHLIELIR